MHEEVEAWVSETAGRAPLAGPPTLGLCLPEAWLFPSPCPHQDLGERVRVRVRIRVRLPLRWFLPPTGKIGSF